MKGYDLVLASGELGFALGFAGHVIEDRRFGYRQPAYIVLGQYFRSLTEGSKTGDPASFSYVTNTLRCNYSLVFQTVANRLTRYTPGIRQARQAPVMEIQGHRSTTRRAGISC